MQRLAPMAYPRAFCNSVVLPDGSVLTVGGQVKVKSLYHLRKTAALGRITFYEAATVGEFVHRHRAPLFA